MLRLKTDRHRIGSSTLSTCAGPSGSPKLAPSRRLSSEATDVSFSGYRNVDSLACMYDDNKPVLLGDDKELHDPHFVRHNWEMMSGDSSPTGTRSHSPWHTSSRRSTVSSRASSSRPPSFSGSDVGHSLAIGLGALSGLSGLPSPNHRKSTQSSYMSGLQVAGSILRDEEAMLADDDSSSDEEDEDILRQQSAVIRRPSMPAHIAHSDHPPRRRNKTMDHQDLPQLTQTSFTREPSSWSRPLLMKDRSMSGPA